LKSSYTLKQAVIGPTPARYFFIPGIDVLRVQLLKLVSRVFQSDPRPQGWSSSV